MYAFLGVVVLSFLAGLILRSGGLAVLATALIWLVLFVGTEIYATVLKVGLAGLSLPRGDADFLVALILWPAALGLALAFTAIGRLVQRRAARRATKVGGGFGKESQ